MNKQKSVETLIQAVQVAQKRGAYSLEEAKLIMEAIEVLTAKEAKEEVTKPAKKK